MGWDLAMPGCSDPKIAPVMGWHSLTNATKGVPKFSVLPAAMEDRAALRAQQLLCLPMWGCSCPCYV